MEVYKMIIDLVRLLRPKQWLKNLFVLLPLFFGGFLFNIYYVTTTILTFIAFCFIASASYCLNDIIDVKEDRIHPIKKYRPIASGSVSIGYAYLLCLIMLMLSFFTVLLLQCPERINLLIIICLYFVLNIAYNLKLKQYSIIDVMLIAIFFVLRVLAGGLGSGIALSPWIVLMTFLVALFLAFSKRRDDVIIFNNENKIVRKNIENYNLIFLNSVLSLLVAVTLVCYILFTVTQTNVNNLGAGKFLYITSLFVIGGFLRYLQIAIVDNKTSSPTQILIKDRFIQGCIFFWFLSYFFILYIRI